MSNLYNKLKVVKSKEQMLKEFEQFFEDKKSTLKLCRSTEGCIWYQDFIRLNTNYMNNIKDEEKFSVTKYKLLLEMLETQYEEKIRSYNV